MSIDEAKIHDHLWDLVRGIVEETLNATLEAEADVLYGAERYEHNPGQIDTCVGSYKHLLHIKACDVILKMSKLRN